MRPEDFVWDAQRPRVSQPVRVGGQVCRYFDTGATSTTARLDWLREGFWEGLAALAEDLRGGRQALHGRARPLVALPMAGAGAGGFGDIRGAALDALLDEARKAAAHGPADVAVVAWRRSDYTALQHRRGEEAWRELSAARAAEADELAERAQRSELALFFGAGISRGAGLPDFATLLQLLEADAGIAGADAAGDLPARAGAVREALGPYRLAERLKSHLPDSHHALGHALLAGLRVPEAITTNFDRLYERAGRVPFDGQLTVVPWQRLPGRGPWLLKPHGDVEHADLVLTAEQYAGFGLERRPVASVVQALFLPSRHILVVGYSLSDANILELVREVAELLAHNSAHDRRFGTVLSLEGDPRDQESEDEHLPLVRLGDGADDADVSVAARRLEIFLDRLAWRASRNEVSWLLDPTYRSLPLCPGRRVWVDASRSKTCSLVRERTSQRPVSSGASSSTPSGSGVGSSAVIRGRGFSVISGSVAPPPTIPLPPLVTTARRFAGDRPLNSVARAGSTP